MYVKGIELRGFRGDPRDGLVTGSVALITERRCVQIQLTVPRKVELLSHRHRLRLLAMALKRARRMPEHRSGETIEFAPGLLPFGLTGIDEPDLTSSPPAPKSERTFRRRRKVPNVRLPLR